MKVVSLFSGCGGLDLGLEQAGHEVILQCEIDPGAQQVLKRRFPGVALIPDVAQLEKLPADAELVAAGFPCVDVSRAGLRAGLEGQSTGVVRHLFRLLKRAIDDRHPIPWVLIENVEALLDRAHGCEPAVARVTATLEALGYNSWAHRVVVSAGFGVPNRRKRVFLLASMHGDARDVMLSQGMQPCFGACCKGVREDGVPAGPCYECYEPGGDEDDDAADTPSGSRPGSSPVSEADNNARAGSPAGSGGSGAGPSSRPGAGTGGAAAPGSPANDGVGAAGDAAAARKQQLQLGGEDDLGGVSLALDLGNARSAPGIDIVPTFTTNNDRICLALADGQVGLLRIEDAERLQGLPEGHTAPAWPIATPGVHMHRGKGIRDSDAAERGRARFALIGNAVTVQVAKWLGERLMNPYHKKYTPSAHNDQPMPKVLQTDVEPPREDEAKEMTEARRAAAHGLLLRIEAPAGGKRTRAGGRVGAGLLLPGEGSSSEDEEDGEEEVKEVSAVGADKQGAAMEVVVEVAGGAATAAAAATRRSVRRAHANTMDAATAATRGGAGGKESEEDGGEEGGDGEVTAVRYGTSRSSRSRRSRGGNAAPSWPRCAWYVRRLGRWAVIEMSEVPVKVPYVPLGSFIRQVGRPPEPEALSICLMRLREQGWDISPTVAKLLASGVALGEHVTGVSRLVGSVGDGAKVGTLVWARDPSKGPSPGAWWPAEALDPYALPPGVTITHAHRAALPQRERASFCPLSATGVHAGGNRGGTRATPATTAGAVGTGGKQDAPSAPMGQAPPEKRKLLVTFFGERSFMWLWSHELLEYRRYKVEKTVWGANCNIAEDLNAMVEARILKCSGLVQRALQEVERAQALQAGAALAAAAGLPPGASNGGLVTHTRSELLAQAAQHAALANKSSRCDVCEACLGSRSSSAARRRCLIVRATAAAAAGHTGAQLSVLGDCALGAKISVWWPLDEAWYTGEIVDFDRLRVRHTVAYVDGDMEHIPLWAPDQVVRVHNTPTDWPKEAARIRAERSAAAQRAAEDLAAKSRSQEPAAVLVAVAEPTAYEKERREQMARNADLLRRLLPTARLPPDLKLPSAASADSDLTTTPAMTGTSRAAAAAGGKASSGRGTVGAPAPKRARHSGVGARGAEQGEDADDGDNEEDGEEDEEEEDDRPRVRKGGKGAGGKAASGKGKAASQETGLPARKLFADMTLLGASVARVNGSLKPRTGMGPPSARSRSAAPTPPTHAPLAPSGPAGSARRRTSAARERQLGESSNWHEPGMISGALLTGLSASGLLPFDMLDRITARNRATRKVKEEGLAGEGGDAPTAPALATADITTAVPAIRTDAAPDTTAATAAATAVTVPGPYPRSAHLTPQGVLDLTQLPPSGLSAGGPAPTITRSTVAAAAALFAKELAVRQAAAKPDQQQHK